MFRKVWIVLIVLMFVTLNAAFAAKISVLFTPGDNVADSIVSEINNAKESVFVQAYSFTSPDIAKAVADAHKRKLNVIVILDKSQKTEKYSSATYLFNNNVPTYIDKKHAIAHNKIIIIDRKIILTGSYNFTKSAEERNAENSVKITDDQNIANQYIDNFKIHLNHSEEYVY